MARPSPRALAVRSLVMHEFPGRAIRSARAICLPALIAIACTGPQSVTDVDPPPDALRVLFIGNSLTYVNDLPGLLGALADSARVARPFWYRIVALPDYSLEDHWSAGAARSAIDSREWDVIVLQQGPSSLPENQAHLRQWSLRFAEPIRAAGARPALYMVWPESTRQTAFSAVSDAYTAAAQAVDGLLFPVGRAWLLAWDRDDDLALYSFDGFHPSVLGTWLAALVMLDRLYENVDLAALPASIRRRDGQAATIPAAARAVLVEAAQEANRSFGR